MSSKVFRLVWIKVRTDNGKKFRLNLPISMNVFRELLDCVDDLIIVACLFAPKAEVAEKSFSIRSVKDMVEMVLGLLGSITDDGPYDLVDVSTDKVKVSIKVR